MPTFKTAVATGLCLLMCACAGGTGKRSSTGADGLSPEEAMLRNQADLKAEFQAIAINIEQLSGKLEESSYFSRNVTKDLQEIDMKLTSLTKKMDEQSRRTELLRDQEEMSYAALATRVEQLRAAVEAANIKVPEKKQAKSPPPTPPKKPKHPPQPEEMYKTAYGAFLNEDFDTAVKSFAAFLREYPDTELSDNALFWLAESYAQLNKKEEAVEHFASVAEKYPGSTKAPGALMRGAEVALETGNKKKTVDLLSTIQEKYPASAEAAKAGRMLEKLK